MRKFYLISAGLFLVYFFISFQGFSEGTKQLNIGCSGNMSTNLYLCNNFTNHCNTTGGVRSEFAVYDATRSGGANDRLYLVTQANEIVYMGFQGAPPNNTKIVFRIKDATTNNIVLAEQDLPIASSTSGFITNLIEACNGPNQLLGPPATAGYDAMEWTPPAPGTYYIEFCLRSTNSGNYTTGQFDIDYFDITVYNSSTSSVKDGRLYSKSWQFSEISNFTGINYILSDDGIVTSIEFNNMDGGAWVQYANQTGCGASNWITSRNSLWNQQALFPQYKVFLNSPDPTAFTIATTLGTIIPPDPYGIRDCNGTIDFIVNVDKAGNVEIDLNFTPATYATRILNQPVTAGSNTISWDGLDGNGVSVPNNVTIAFTVKYINGLTNLPLYDVEGNTSGFLVNLIAPPGTAPHIFWNDSLIWLHTANSQDVKTNVATGGCLSPATFPGCHKWPSTGGGWGNMNTINSWWYNVSTSTTYPPISQWRSPQPLLWAVGPLSVCAGQSGVSVAVASEPNTETYHWAYSGTGATFLPSTNTSSPNVTINFAPDATSGNITVYGTNTNCNSTPSAPISLAVAIHPIPVPTLAGPPSVCNLSTGNVYTTESGNVNYSWSITGGTITSGGSFADNTATVTWNTPGPQTISVTYASTYGCAAASPVVYNVTVNPLPTPAFNSAPVTACVNVGGYTYATQPGMSNYQWNVTGGTVTAGGTTSSNTVTVNWTTPGTGTVSVNYTDPATSCTAIMPTIVSTTVYALPTPVFSSGPSSVCVGTSGHTYTVQAGMDQYSWAVTGGTVTAGGSNTENFVTVTWNTTGAQTISANFTDPATGCTAASPTVYNVIVHPLPVPTISGQGAACLNTSATYTTEAGMSGYVWNVVGGSIGGGGGGTDNAITILWNTLGPQSVSVNYNDANGCTATTPTVYNVQVNNLPVPTITGNNPVCVGLSQNYSTEAGMSTYTWNISAGGSITAGAGTNSITVLWNTVGPQTVDVNYTIGTGCTAATPTVKNIIVNALPVPTVNGQATVCQNTTHIYSTEAGMTSYSWTVPAQGTITAGGGTNSITVLWTAPGNPVIQVNYINSNLCTAVSPTNFPVTVNPAPVPAITGPSAACLNSTSTFTTDAGMSGYTWTVAGGNITGGAGTNTIQVLWNTVGSHNITASYTNTNGCLPLTPSIHAVTVNPLPLPVISGPQQVCYSQTGSVYSSPAVANHDYVWTVTGAVSFTGNHTNSITVDWGPSGSGTIQLTEVDQSQPTNCSTTTPVYNVIINPAPTPVITGLQAPCGQTTQLYTIGPPLANHSYLWTVTGGTPASGANSSISVNWGNTNPVTIDIVESITYAPGVVCSAHAPAFPVNLVLIPDAAGVISGPSSACQTLSKTYTVAPINNSDSYTWWYVPAAGVTITNNGASAILSFGLTSASGSLFVQGNKTGCSSGPASPALPITVFDQPYVSLTACNDIKTTSTSRPFALKGGVPSGGQYLIDGTISATGIFDPAVHSTTTHQVTYRYTDFHGCINTSPSVPITVAAGSSLLSCPNTFTDVRDNKTYRSFMMGGRCWMLENLTYGSQLSPSDQPQRDNCVAEKYCLATDPSCTAYGGLYQWDELMQYQVPGPGQLVQGLCPPEWHVPTQAEFQMLVDGQINGGNGIAGADMKDPVPAFGFHGLIMGIYYQNNLWNFTSGNLTATMFWTAGNSGTTRAMARGLNSINPSVATYFSGRSNAFPVRCVKD